MRVVEVIINDNGAIKKIVVTPNSVDELIKKIRNDIYYLSTRGRVHEKDIKISMPYFIQELLDNYIRRLYWQKKDLKDLLGNYEFVLGFNNLICVFDKKAHPSDFVMEPFKVEFDEK